MLSTQTSISVREVPIEWNPDLPIYASEAYLRSIEEEYGWLGGFDADGQLSLVLPYTITKKLFLRMVRFRTETIHLSPALTLEDETSFLNGVVEHFRRRGVDLIVPPSANSLFRVYPPNAINAPYGSFAVDLSLSEDSLWKNVHGKHRNVIRSAKSKGVEIRSGPGYVNIVHDLVRRTLGRSDMGFMNLSRFKSLAANLGDRMRLFVAFSGEIPQGAAAVPFSAHAAYYLYGGSIERPTTGAMNLLHWEAIRHFRNLGVRRYDLMGVRLNPVKGSKQEGLKMFKERFGGELHQGHMWKYSFHPLKSFIYSCLSRFRDGGDVVDQEKRVSRRITGVPFPVQRKSATV